MALARLRKIDPHGDVALGLVAVGCGTACIWLVLLPIFHLVNLGWIESWEARHSAPSDASVERCAEALRLRYATPHDAFGALDADGNGKASSIEWRHFAERLKHSVPEHGSEQLQLRGAGLEQLGSCFVQLDVDGDGNIQAGSEFFKVFGSHADWLAAARDHTDQAPHVGATTAGPTQRHDAPIIETNVGHEASSAELVMPEKNLTSAKAASIFSSRTLTNSSTVIASGSDGSILSKNGASTSIMPVSTTTSGGIETAETEIVNVTRIGGELPRPQPRNVSKTASARTVWNISSTRKELVKTPSNAYHAKRILSWPMGWPSEAKRLSAGEMLHYTGVPAHVSGHTELYFVSSTGMSTWYAAITLEGEIKPVFEATMEKFTNSNIVVQSVHVGVKQVNISWQMDLTDGGGFQINLQNRGAVLEDWIVESIKTADLRMAQGINVDEWTVLTVQYQRPSTNLPRGSSLKQRTGTLNHISDNGSPPFTLDSMFVQ